MFRTRTGSRTICSLFVFENPTPASRRYTDFEKNDLEAQPAMVAGEAGRVVVLTTMTEAGAAARWTGPARIRCID